MGLEGMGMGLEGMGMGLKVGGGCRRAQAGAVYAAWSKDAFPRCVACYAWRAWCVVRGACA